MKQARWGVMTHYLAEWIAPEAHRDAESWNRMVDGFDAQGLAKQLAAAGAGYYLITLGQNSGFYISPNAAYDRLAGIQPSKCARRDLVADLHEALKPYGIRLMVYLPSGAPGRDAAAVKALEWTRGPYPNREFKLKWERVIREWSLRWGTKVSGWWLDGCYWPNAMYRSPEAPNFASLAAAVRARNPASIVAFNNGVIYSVISLSEHEDYTAGEANEPERINFGGSRFANGRVDGAYPHMLSYLGSTWGKGAAPRFSDAQVIGWTRKLAERGAVTWDAPIQPNGLIPEPFLRQLKALGVALGGT
ncbi:MAG: alpha-L-fucosidase [Acidobacteria bacterium]|nr:alpha-L-fucosidase [Acidobacteriota bacterium]